MGSIKSADSDIYFDSISRIRFIRFRDFTFKTGEKASVAMAAGILICSGVYIVVSNISGALFSASISIWAGVCAVAGGLTFVQVKRLFSAGEMVFEEA